MKIWFLLTQRQKVNFICSSDDFLVCCLLVLIHTSLKCFGQNLEALPQKLQCSACSELSGSFFNPAKTVHRS